MSKATLAQVDWKDKTVFLRADFNVPVEDGRIRDEARITAARPTIDLLREKGAKLLLASHLGRPKGAPDPKYSLAPVAEALGVPLLPTVGAERAEAMEKMKAGDAVLLENTRFHPGETKNDPAFAAALVEGCDAYVTDAFGSLHRAHASTEGAARLVRERGGPALPGLLVEKEVAALARLRDDPPRPYMVLLGGAKVSDKIDLVRALLEKADEILIGGAMAFPFLKAQGGEVGASKCSAEDVSVAKDLLEEAKRKGVPLRLPEDVAAAPNPDEPPRFVPAAQIPSNLAGFDVGARTVASFSRTLRKARAVFWNGPMGLFEKEPYGAGTREVAKALAACATAGAMVVVGGGDSAAAVRAFGLTEKMTHVSTGGGAALAFLEGKTLPGLAVLR